MHAAMSGVFRDHTASQYVRVETLRHVACCPRARICKKGRVERDSLWEPGCALIINRGPVLVGFGVDPQNALRVISCWEEAMGIHAVTLRVIPCLRIECKFWLGEDGWHGSSERPLAGHPNAIGSGKWKTALESSLQSVARTVRAQEHGGSVGWAAPGIVQERAESQNGRISPHPRRRSVRGTRHIACHLHGARSAQPPTTCPCRSVCRASDGEFSPQIVAWRHGHVASLDWL